MKVAIAGYERLEKTDKLKEVIISTLTHLVESGADTFYFCGTNEGFDYLCYKALGELIKSCKIKRVLARAHYECVGEDCFDYVVEFTEERSFRVDLREELTAYLKPYNAVIDLSDALLTCYDDNCISQPRRANGGVQSAVKYAKIKRKKIINIFDIL